MLVTTISSQSRQENPCHKTIYPIFNTIHISNHFSKKVFNRLMKYKLQTCTYPLIISFLSSCLVFITWCAALHLSDFPMEIDATTITLSLLPLIIGSMRIWTELINSEEIHIDTSNANKQDSQNSSSSANNNGNVGPIVGGLKSVAQLTPIIAGISFIFVLTQYWVVMNNNLSAAIHATTIQLAEYKYEWISTVFIIAILFYLTYPPKILSIALFDLIYKYQDRKNTIYKPSTNLAFPTIIYYLLMVALSGTTATFLSYQLSWPHTPLTSLFILTFISISFTHGNNHLLNNSFPLEGKINKSENWMQNSPPLKIALSLIFLASIILPGGTLVPAIKTSVILGSTISTNTENITDSNTNIYSCVFSVKEGKSEPVTFGVILSSKGSSIHSLSPVYNTSTKDYMKRKNDNKLYPYRLAETYTKSPDNFYIEKYNSSLHMYDPISGKCFSHNPPPFRETAVPRTKLVIRNIP